MDDETLRALVRGMVIEELERALAGRRATRLSPAEIEQRRAAAQVSASSRHKKAAALQKRRAKAEAKASTARSTETEAESETSERAVQRRGNGEYTAEQSNISTGGEPPNSAQIAPATRVWLRYSTAFKLRYGAFPPRNARANGLLTHLLKLIPVAEAPDVAEFYVKTDDPLYARANHPLQLLVRDAEKLSVMAATGRVKAEAAPPRPWWEVWSGVQEQARQLGIDEAAYDNPTMFRRDVLKAAAAWGSLPPEAAARLGMQPHEQE